MPELGLGAGVRVALVHATPVAMAPVHDAFAAYWPEAATFDLLESGLSRDAVAYPDGIADFDARFLSLARYARDVGARGVLFTCSAFGSHIDKAARTVAPVPVLKPNEAMFAHALGAARRVAMIATFKPAIAEMEREFDAMASRLNPGAQLTSYFAEGAIEALRAGDAASHDALCAEAAQRVEADAEIILLAHFSTARAQQKVAGTTSLPVLSSPESAVVEMQRQIGAQNSSE